MSNVVLHIDGWYIIRDNYCDHHGDGGEGCHYIYILHGGAQVTSLVEGKHYGEKMPDKIHDTYMFFKGLLEDE